MIQAIKDRKKERQQHLETLESALKVLSVHERAYAHLYGRIRGVEDEISWLSMIEEDMKT